VNDTLQGTLYNYSNSCFASNRAQVPRGTFYKRYSVWTDAS